jgi:nucleoside-diphosphate-sugar epimerase
MAHRGGRMRYGTGARLMRLFVFGAGYSGRAVARRLSVDAEWIGGTTRSPENFAALSAAGMEPILFGEAGLSQDGERALATATHLLISAGPDGSGDPVLRITRPLLSGMPALRWVAYLSTVGVYGDHAGAWVDEATPCRPVSRRSVQRLTAEKEWQEFSQQSGLPLAVLRLSGIYGRGRNAFVNLHEGTAKRIIKQGQVFNRVHVDDIAGAVAHIAGSEASGLFNLTDDEPAPPQDVLLHAALLMGVEPPPAIRFEEADLTPMARSFYGENKRVSNARIGQTSYRFHYPTYREGLEHMWRSSNWQAE